ncbi:hypothetical protein, partial [uncultured Alistipes sp.]|uniref:hypothetical protein n=1 Tax=uncultured Alistipes sp. TaxID=538949 RepID=UPI00266CD6DA
IRRINKKRGFFLASNHRATPIFLTHKQKTTVSKPYFHGCFTPTQQPPEFQERERKGISNNLAAFMTKATRSPAKNQEIPVSCGFLNRDRTREMG